MALTVTLVDGTYNRLRYLVVNDGVVSSPPVAADNAITIGNDAAATPDLRTDIGAVAPDGATSGSQLRAAIRARLDGYGPLAPGARTQAQARAIFNSDDAGNVLGNQNVLTCILDVNGRTGPQGWAVDADVDGQGDPVIDVLAELGVAGDAYVDFYVRDTWDL